MNNLDYIMSRLVIKTKIKKGIYLGLSQEEYKIHKREYQHQYYLKKKAGL